MPLTLCLHLCHEHPRINIILLRHFVGIFFQVRFRGVGIVG